MTEWLSTAQHSQKFCTNSLKSGNHGEDRAELSCQWCYEVSVKAIIGKQLWAPWECSYLQYSSCRDLSSTQTEVAGQPWNLKHSSTNRSDHGLHGPTGCPFTDIRTMQMCSTLHLLHSGQWRNKKREKKLILNWLWFNIKFELISSKKLVIILTLKWQNYFKGHPYQAGFCPFLVLPYEKKWQFQS